MSQTAIEALQQARQRMRNCWGAIQSNQVIDKDVEGSLKRGMDEIDAALSALSTKLQEPVGEISVLPCDVTVGSTIFRKGVNFGIFVRALQRHHHLEQRDGK